MPRALARSHPFGMAPRPTNRSRQEPPRSCHLLCCSQYLSCGNIRTIVVAYVYKEQLGAIVWETIITCKWLLVSDKGISGQMFRKKELFAYGCLCINKGVLGQMFGKQSLHANGVVSQKKELRGKCMGNSHYTQLVACMLKRTFRGRCFGKQSLYASGFLYLKLMFSS